jgi:hypothetical protein
VRDRLTALRLMVDVEGTYARLMKRVRILKPASNYPLPENNAVLYRGADGGPLVAVNSLHAKNAWKWEGLYEWPVEVEMPALKRFSCFSSSSSKLSLSNRIVLVRNGQCMIGK